MTIEKGNTAEVVERLDIVIALLLKTIPRAGDGLALRDQVQLLSDLGIRPKDIAKILGRSQTYVNKELAGLRKAGGNRRKP